MADSSPQTGVHVSSKVLVAVPCRVKPPVRSSPPFANCMPRVEGRTTATIPTKTAKRKNKTGKFETLSTVLIKNTHLYNKPYAERTDVLIRDGVIERIGASLACNSIPK